MPATAKSCGSVLENRFPPAIFLGVTVSSRGTALDRDNCCFSATDLWIRIEDAKTMDGTQDLTKAVNI